MMNKFKKITRVKNIHQYKMYYNVSTTEDVKNMTGGNISKLKKKNVIILVRMDGCMHCDMMKPEWNKMVEHTRNKPDLDILEIERNMMAQLLNKDRAFFEPQFRGIQGFPSIHMNDSNRKITPFQNRRTSESFIDFIKHNSTPISVNKKTQAIKKPTAKKPTAKKPTVKKPTAKKPTVKKPTVKKPTAKKPTAKKKKPTAKK